MRSFFARLDEKHKLLWNFERILKFFDKNSLEKLNFLFFYFYFLSKICDFIYPWELTSFFYNNFFGFGGGISPLSPPWLRPWDRGALKNLLQALFIWAIRNSIQIKWCPKWMGIHVPASLKVYYFSSHFPNSGREMFPRIHHLGSANGYYCY